jgi:hypothetical protein
MPMHNDSSPVKFQAFISNYVAESLASSYLGENDVDIWITSE